MLLAVSLHLLLSLLLPDFFRVLKWNAGGLRVRSTERLHCIWSYPFDPICIQQSNFNLFFSFRIPGFSVLRFNCTYSRFSIFSIDTTHASGSIIIFVMQGLSFSEFSTSSLSSLDPFTYSDYAGVNISLNDFSLSFLNAYSSPICSSPRDSRSDSFLSPFFLPPQISLFWGIVTTITPTGTQKVLLTLVGRKYSIGSSPLTSTMTLTYLFFSIASLAIAPPLTSPFLPPLLLLKEAS